MLDALLKDYLEDHPTGQLSVLIAEIELTRWSPSSTVQLCSECGSHMCVRQRPGEVVCRGVEV